MTSFYPDGGDEARVRWSIVDALRRYGTDAWKIGQVFSAQHELRMTDLQALVAIMSAEGRGEPLTPGALRQVLGLSSAGTSYVIDRLAGAGHVERHRDHPTDSRVVHLRYTEQGQATALAFFGPLGAATEKVIDDFTPQELQVVARFLDAAAAATRNHLRALESADPGGGEPGAGAADA